MKIAKGTQRQGDSNSAGGFFCARCSSFFGKHSPPVSNAQHPPYKDKPKLTQALEGWDRSAKGEDTIWITFISMSPKEKQNLLFWRMFTPAGKAVAGWQNVPGNRFHGRSHSSGYLPARPLQRRVPTGRAVAGMFKGASTPTAFLRLHSSANRAGQEAPAGEEEMPAVFLLQTICTSSVQHALRSFPWTREVVSAQPGSQHPPVFLAVGTGLCRGNGSSPPVWLFPKYIQDFWFLGAAEPVAGEQSLATTSRCLDSSLCISPCTSAEMSDRGS